MPDNWRRMCVELACKSVVRKGFTLAGIIFPGFMIPSGSSACLIDAIASSTAAPCSALKILHLALPDAVLAGTGSFHRQRALDQAVHEGVRARDLVAVIPCRPASDMWKLPSPTWPTIGAINRDSMQSRWLSDNTFGEPRDRHADVGGDRLGTRAAGRGTPSSRHAAACHSVVRSSALLAHSKGPPPNSAGNLAETRSTCSAAPCSVPWNSTNSIGLSGNVSFE